MHISGEKKMYNCFFNIFFFTLSWSMFLKFIYKFKKKLPIQHGQFRMYIYDCLVFCHWWIQFLEAITLKGSQQNTHLVWEASQGTFTHWLLGEPYIKLFLKLISVIDILWISSKNCPQVNSTKPHWWLVNTGSGKGLVPSGTKPLPEPVLTQLHVSIWHRQATMS